MAVFIDCLGLYPLDDATATVFYHLVALSPAEPCLPRFANSPIVLSHLHERNLALSSPYVGVEVDAVPREGRRSRLAPSALHCTGPRPSRPCIPAQKGRSAAMHAYDIRHSVMWQSL